jgi:AcrR family transcriptional regulator
MGARAKATEATREKILEATEKVFGERPLNEVTLDAVAKRSGLAVQTVLRHFGSRDGLLMASLVHTGLKMGRHRDAASADDVPGAVDLLVDHYDRFGDGILRLLGAEERHPALVTFTDSGRDYHREWCEEVFAASLKGMRGTERQRRIAQLVAVTDVYTWKLLRRDRGLSLPQTKLAIHELLERLMEPPGS